MINTFFIFVQRNVALVICISFVAFTIVLGSGAMDFKPRQPTDDSAARVDTTPVRVTLFRPVYRVRAFSFYCNECHRSIPRPYVAGRSWTQHMGVQMAHGINRRCLNCHHPVNREAFIDGDGNEIPWDEPERLCAKCHGPVYRDWQHGSHGRINGYWDRSKGVQVRRKCVECHDPHDPPFPPLTAMPGPRPPHGETGEHHRDPSARNPLRVMDQVRRKTPSASVNDE